MKEDQVKEYAHWLLEVCDNPIDEIEWLVSNLNEDTQNDIRYNVLGFIKQNKDE